MTRHLVPVLLAYAGVAWTQSISGGIKAGIPLTQNFDAQSGGYTKSYFASSAKTRRYTLGLTATLSLPHRFGIEIDGLYRRLNYDWYNVSYPSASDAGVIATRTTATGNRIEIPVLLKWSPLGRLYVVGGGNFAGHYSFEQNSRISQQLILAGYSDRTVPTDPPFASRWSKGLTFGAGLDFRAGRLHIKPEVRYTHWIALALESYLYLGPSADEGQLLVGFEFGSRK